MENIIEIFVQKMLEAGVYDLAIFVLALAIFYALLDKFKFLGGSKTVNAVIAFCVAFLILGYPVLVGFSLTLPFSIFFSQTLLWIMLFFIGLLIASMFYPDLPSFLSEHFMDSRTMLWVGITLTIISIVVSGMIGIFYERPATEGMIQVPPDLSVMATGIIIFLAVLLIGSATVLAD